MKQTHRLSLEPSCDVTSDGQADPRRSRSFSVSRSCPVPVDCSEERREFGPLSAQYAIGNYLKVISQQGFVVALEMQRKQFLEISVVLNEMS